MKTDCIKTFCIVSSILVLLFNCKYSNKNDETKNNLVGVWNNIETLKYIEENNVTEPEPMRIIVINNTSYNGIGDSIIINPFSEPSYFYSNEIVGIIKKYTKKTDKEIILKIEGEYVNDVVIKYMQDKLINVKIGTTTKTYRLADKID